MRFSTDYDIIFSEIFELIFAKFIIIKFLPNSEIVAFAEFCRVLAEFWRVLASFNEFWQVSASFAEFCRVLLSSPKFFFRNDKIC